MRRHTPVVTPTRVGSIGRRTRPPVRGGSSARQPTLRADARPGHGRSLALVGAVYLLAGAAAWATVALLDVAPLTETLLADVVATVVVFGAVGAVCATLSLYDPYWCVAPPVIAIAWAASRRRRRGPAGARLAWSSPGAIRLTAQLGHRLARLPATRTGATSTCACRRAGRLPLWFVNLAGIQLMPTLLVFVGPASAWAGGRPPARGRSGARRGRPGRHRRRDRRRGAGRPAAAPVRRATRPTGAASPTAGCGGGRATRTTSARSASGRALALRAGRRRRTGGGPSSGRWPWSRCSCSSASR